MKNIVINLQDEAIRIARKLAIPCKSNKEEFVQLDRLYAIVAVNPPKIM